MESKIDWEALGRRAVACKHWRLLPGMLDTFGYRLLAIEGNKALFAHREDICWFNAWDSDTPDLTDPATIGCLLALVREAWGEPSIATYPRVTSDGRVDGWRVSWWYRTSSEWQESEAEALVAALEAACK